MSDQLIFNNTTLYQMYKTGQLKRTDGTTFIVKDQISIKYANALYSVVKNNKFEQCLEVGMACGVSSLTIASALSDSGVQNPTLISIDPYQTENYEQVGLLALKDEGLDNLHTIIEDFDYYSLPELLKKNHSLDFAYIDGWHTFDYALLNFFYVDKMLRVGGIVGFNDCGMRSVNRVIRFLKSNRKYKEIDVGLVPNYQASNTVKSLYKRLRSWSSQDRYFEKIVDWEPEFDFYGEF